MAATRGASRRRATRSTVLLAMAGLLAVPAARAEEFACPEGAKDSGYREHQVVRWCGYEKDGRIVFHGPVWRFHKNGRLLAKEHFVHGELDGERWFFYESGRPASAGPMRSGERTGVWRSWDEEGHLTAEDGYTDGGVDRDVYYPSGKKRASGMLRDGAKVGFWELYYEDGGKKRCDFGEGLFALPDDDGCRTIADEVEPRGFARPVPKGTVTEDGVAIVSIGGQSYAFTVPPGWVADATAGAGMGLPLVLYPKGSAWKDPHRNMWIRVILKEGRVLDVVTYDERMAFAKRVGQYQEFLLAPRQGRLGRVDAETLSYTIPTGPGDPFKMVEGRDMLGAAAFIDVSPEVVLVVVGEADYKVPMKASRDPFIAFVSSARPPGAPPPPER